ncbi:hypothetical protein E4U55_002545 [Claviceps digitariae]|nr:hypothetical protein E4U55_002545 [Claviceps digitariae]
MVSCRADGLLRRALPPKSTLQWHPDIVLPRRQHFFSTRCASKLAGRPRRHPAPHAAAAAGKARFKKHNVSHSPLHPRPAPPTELDKVLVAVQGQQPDQVYRAFRAWTRILGIGDEAAVRRAQELPGPSFSEILRSLDPLPPLSDGKHIDIAHELNLTQGLAQFIHISQWVTRFGVRRRHRLVLRGMMTLLAVRSRSPLGLSTADHEVMLRCAGVAADYQASKTIWAKMAESGLQHYRTAKTWLEFVKARFMTEPIYYQFDRSRVAVMARDLYSNRNPLSMATLKRMDRMRLSINAMKRHPWNRRPDVVDEDMRRLLRRKSDFRSYKSHWIRNLYFGHDVDEELMCASIIAFARSSSLHAIKSLVFNKFYGIHFDEQSEPGNPRISGGHELPPSSRLRPTTRLLHAIVEALGSMSHILLAMKLLDFISQRYNIVIPPETWSNLLNWTYLCASKPFRPMRRLYEREHPSISIRTTTAPVDVRAIWNAMTSAPYNVTPTFHDYDVLIKTLLIQRSLRQALAVIRNNIIPLHQRAQSDHELALFDEILQSDLGPSSPQATRRRIQAALHKDYIRHHITSWLNKLLKIASKNSGYRDHDFTKTVIPDLLLEFADFFPPQVRYRTAQGVVQLIRPEFTTAPIVTTDRDLTGPTVRTIPPRFSWLKAMRETLPQKKAGIYARHAPDVHHPQFPYPTVPTMKILEWRRVPTRRSHILGRAPKTRLNKTSGRTRPMMNMKASRQSGPGTMLSRVGARKSRIKARKWWINLAEELML